MSIRDEILKRENEKDNACKEKVKELKELRDSDIVRCAEKIFEILKSELLISPAIEVWKNGVFKAKNTGEKAVCCYTRIVVIYEETSGRNVWVDSESSRIIYLAVRNADEVKDVLKKVSASLSGEGIQIYNQLYPTKGCGISIGTKNVLVCNKFSDGEIIVLDKRKEFEFKLLLKI